LEFDFFASLRITNPLLGQTNQIRQSRRMICTVSNH
jgi:hypothetical protein